MENENIPTYNAFVKVESEVHAIKEAFHEIPNESIQLEVVT